MKKKGLAKVGQVMANISTGKIKDFNYKRKPLAKWELSEDQEWVLDNVNIVDVDSGKLKAETAVLVEKKRIKALLNQEALNEYIEVNPELYILNGRNRYLIPGLSDLHCHPALITEHNMTMKTLYYADGQRMRNCEFALENGCTFLRTSGGSYDMESQLVKEIDEDRLLGPKMLSSYFPLIPKGGCWDFNPLVNKSSDIIFGGSMINHIKTDQELEDRLSKLTEMNSGAVKIYLEEKPLYGGDEDMCHNFFTAKQLRRIREYASNTNKTIDAHAMFIKGARLGINAKINTIAHLTVDEPYSLEDAMNMKNNNVAVIPTLGAGCFLAMDCGDQGYPNHPEFKYYRRLLKDYIPKNTKAGTIPELTDLYMDGYNFILERNEKRKMPMMGPIYPKRAHGFAVHAKESFHNFQKAGTKIGMGTDGGPGIMWVGALNVEFRAYAHYGFTPNEILRIATLGNMEILGLENEYGSLDVGKYADMVLLENNPLEDETAIESVKKVFKNGRCYIDNE